MKTIVIPQFYRGPSGQKGLYNRQEVGLARAFAALGCRAVVLYPEPGAKAPRIETPEPNVKICYMPAVAFGVQAFYKSWQILLDEHADAVHVMGDGAVPLLPKARHPVLQPARCAEKYLQPRRRAQGHGPAAAPQSGGIPQNAHLRQNPRRRRRAGKPRRALRGADARRAGHRHHPVHPQQPHRDPPCAQNRRERAGVHLCGPP